MPTPQTDRRTESPSDPADSGVEAPGNPPRVGPVNRHSPAEDKIALFRSLFRGRDDVYARRFESWRTGRSGYQPACAHEWVQGICEKPRIRCSECLRRQFLPVTDAVIRWHLSGTDAAGHPFVMGVYPMLRDETCFFLAVDLDGEFWREDARAVWEACRILDLPVTLERSRSGQGGHFWFFFEDAIPAGMARKLGSAVLTRAMEARPEIGLRSYDRLFPNQDTLPTGAGGLGNLIALPLQREPRTRGNSTFVDEAFVAFSDPWEFLSQARRLSYARVQSLVREAESRDGVLGVRAVAPDWEGSAEPWTLTPSRRRLEPVLSGPLPHSLDLVLSDQVYIPKAELPPGLRNRLLRLAAFQNPEFHKAQAMRLPTHTLPRIIACAEDFPDHLGLPRGCLPEIETLLTSLGVKHSVRDERCTGRASDWTFQGVLTPDQQTAANALLAHEIGVLAATTAFGKTVVASWLIAARKVSTLVLVHRQQLLEQWVDRLAHFLGIPPKSIGALGGGRKRLTGGLDVALVQSLVRQDIVRDEVAQYGHLVIDECHRVCARSFELVARRAKARFVVGLSATPTRKDGHHPILFMQCGPIRHRVDARRQAAARPFTHQVLVRPTAFRAADGGSAAPRAEFQRLVAAVALDSKRNAMICDDVRQAMTAGRSVLVLTERTDHLDLLAAQLTPQFPQAVVLRGGLNRTALRESLQRLAGMASDCKPLILATGRFIGEGFDESRLDTLMVTLPVSWHGTIAQYVGRLHRLHDGKREVIVYDYADLEVTMLRRMFERRCRGYEAVGYSLLIPASALPGWPAEVPLPVDPTWKRTYAASIERLIRDGVNGTLGNLFVGAASSPSPGPETEGVLRARSAAEAFLFQRLETLDVTRGRFRVNALLPIPFDNCGRMEVDLVDESSRIVIEIDGPQHLGDPVAYRRDRRKDALLQEHHYLVLRVLAEDVTRDLESTLDAILRAVARRSRSAAGSGVRRPPLTPRPA